MLSCVNLNNNNPNPNTNPDPNPNPDNNKVKNTYVLNKDYFRIWINLLSIL